MRGPASVATRLLRHVGIYKGKPRIYNADLGTYTVGYTEINVMATTAFSRTKTHKAWLDGTTDIVNGTRITDMVDGKNYLTMSLKVEYIGDTVAFLDGTLFYCNAVCGISRVSTAVDSFGRTTATGFTTSDSGVWAMINPIAYEEVSQPDRYIDKDKIKIAMQGTVDLRDNDRIITDTNEKYKVLTFNRSEIPGLVTAYAELDTR